MEEKSRIKQLYEHVETYARSTFELYRLKAIKSFAETFASVSTGIVLGLIFSMILLFASIGLALYLGAVFGGWHYGFFSVAGVYALFALIIYIYRVKCLKEKITDYILKEIFKD
ncbi:MAG TPA: hypothetical protein VGB43_08325 [Flavobacterium sp.]|jgi:hypothetical protein